MLGLCLFSYPAVNISLPGFAEFRTQSQTEQNTTPVVFRFLAPNGTKSVSLVGDFNDWSIGKNPLIPDNDGYWKIVLPITYGHHQYKFVLNGKDYVTDPTAPSESDGNGHTNSWVLVQPPDYGSKALKHDGIIAQSALQSDAQLPYLNFDQGELEFKLRTRPNDIALVDLVFNSEGKHQILPMTAVSQDDLFATYSVKVPWNQKADFSYDYLLDDSAVATPRTHRYFGPNGIQQEQSTNVWNVRAAEYKPFVVPNWVQHSVIYQIFPDRFADGDQSNDPPNVQSWGGTPTYFNFFGGDFAGVDQHLSYLKSLGINCIYFNPIFEGPSNHHYETSDYFKVDHRLGTNAEFQKLTELLSENGIKTVLDGVFNHSSTELPQFADVVKNGAASPYVHWYTFYGFPVRIGNPPNYLAWFNYPSLPKFNHSNPDVQKFILSVPTYWNTHADISGWRLDAANEVPDFMWQKFRKTVKALNPNDWIVGELWTDATHYLKGDMWDSVMNYPFLFATVAFLKPEAPTTADHYWSALSKNYHAYPPQVARNLMNLIDSHDTARILYQVGGNRQLANLAAILEFAWPGVPTVYYGDEIGMTGGPDPMNRKCMDWSQATGSNPVLRMYRKLIAARNTSPVLQTGDVVRMEPLNSSEDEKTSVLAFARVLAGQIAICVVNRSSDEQTVHLKLPKPSQVTSLTPVLTSGSIHVSNDEVSIILPPESGDIYLAR